MPTTPNPIVISCDLPEQSALHERISSTDFVDCYSVDAETQTRRAAEIITSFPAWAQFLLHVRTIVTAPFGLLRDGPEAADKLGLFPIEQETENEIIAGFNDKHLDFRVSVFSNDSRFFLGTWVHPHNFGGRLYLKLIMPFHILIARNALRRVANARRS